MEQLSSQRGAWLRLNPCLNGRGVVRSNYCLYNGQWYSCLNPCLNGRGVVSTSTTTSPSLSSGLNPCLNGRGVVRGRVWLPFWGSHVHVLILV